MTAAPARASPRSTPCASSRLPPSSSTTSPAGRARRGVTGRPSGSAASGRWTGYGSLGPELFFVISGFVILMTAWGRPTAQVVASRVGAALPGLLGRGADAPARSCCWSGRRASRSPRTRCWSTSRCCSRPLGVDHVDGVYWTLWTELRFYLLARRASRWSASPVAGCVGVALLWPWVALLAEHAGATGLATLLVADYAPLFAAGMALFVLVSDREARPTGGCCRGWPSDRTPRWPSRSWSRRAPRCSSGPPGTSPRPRCSPWPSSGASRSSRSSCSPGWRAGSTAGLVALGALTYPLYLVHEYWGLGGDPRCWRSTCRPPSRSGRAGRW